ncbi:MAG: hypothetical protein HOP11_13510 [Saprospiraceae bacterium]|nr:hypothetical protein [Saprospiraceae bacterium]
MKEIIIKLSILLSFLCVVNVNAQISFSLTPQVSDVKHLIITDHLIPNSLSSNSSASLIMAYSSGAIEPIFKNFIVGMMPDGSLAKSYEAVSSGNKKFNIERSLLFNNVLYCLVADNSSNKDLSLYLVAIDYAKAQVFWEKKIDQIDYATRFKIIGFRNSIYVGYQITDNGNEVTAIQNFDLKGSFNWSRNYIGIEGKEEYFNDLIVHLSGDIYLVTKQLDSVNASASRIRIHKLNATGVPVKSSVFSFLNQTGGSINRFGDVFLEANGNNLHVAVQEIVGRDGFGKITITMIDTSLTLRTWRNYSGELILEDFNMSPGRFLLSGQRPVNDGKEGYAIAAINNLNAIPEVTHTFLEGFYNSSIASHSYIGTSGSRNLVLVAKAGKSSEQFISVARTYAGATGPCNPEFTFLVTKDGLQLNEDQLIVSNIVSPTIGNDLLNLSLREIDVASYVFCFNLNTTKPNADSPSIISSDFSTYVEIKNEINKAFISVSSSDGKLIDTPILASDTDNLSLDIRKLHPGIYFLIQGNKLLGKFIKL